MTGQDFNLYPPMTDTIESDDSVLMIDASDHSASSAGTVHQPTVGELANTFPVLGGYVTAVQPSSDTSGAADTAAWNAAVTALGGNQGRILFGDGDFYVDQPTMDAIEQSGVYVDGVGKWATRVHAVGAGDVFRMYDGSPYQTRTVSGGGVRGMSIDGASATGASNGIHVGDIFQLQWDVAVSNFDFNSSSVGVKFDNNWAIAEEMSGRIDISNCYTGVLYTQTPAIGNTFCYGSFMRGNVRVTVNQGNPAYTGIAVENGAYLNDGILKVGGNFGGSSSALTSAVFALSGSTPSGSQDTGTIPSNISEVTFDVAVECEPGSTYNPTTFSVGPGCYVGPTYGRLNFGAAGTTFTPTSAVIGFYGHTTGDPNIVAQTSETQLYQGITAVGTYAATQPLTTGSTIPSSASYVAVSSTANVTGIIIDPGSYDGQELFIANTTAHTVTFAATATSHVADGATTPIPASTGRFLTWSVNAGVWCRAA